MSNRPILSIPTPCHEGWAAMTPTTQGRHCAACNKVVLDFTQKTDAEIMALLRHVSQPCGRLTTSQLNRPLVPPPPVAPRWRTWLAATAAVLGLREAGALAGHAQLLPPTERVITMGMVAAPYRGPQPPAGLSVVVVRGRVIDNSSGDGLPGVTVLLKHTIIGVSTAADGTFELQVPASDANQVLVFSSVGFVTQERSLDPDSTQNLLVNLTYDSRELGGLIVTGYAVLKPWPWHPRALWYQLTRSFQR